MIEARTRRGYGAKCRYIEELLVRGEANSPVGLRPRGQDLERTRESSLAERRRHYARWDAALPTTTIEGK